MRIEERYARPSEPFEVEISNGDVFTFQPYSDLKKLQEQGRTLSKAKPTDAMRPYWTQDEEILKAVATLAATCVGVKYLIRVIERPGADPEKVYEESPKWEQLDWLALQKTNPIVFQEIFASWGANQYGAQAKFEIQAVEAAGEDSEAIP